MTDLQRIELADLRERLFKAQDEIIQLEGQIDLSVKGFITMKMIRCGKPYCKCAAGALHGPYPHLQYIGEDKKLHQKYLNRKIASDYNKIVTANHRYRALKVQEKKLAAEIKRKEKAYK